MISVNIPGSLLPYNTDKLRDEQLGRYVRLAYHCACAGGEYQGRGADFERDFGIGRNAVSTALRAFTERGLILVRVEGESHWPRGEDRRTWSVRMIDQG